MFTGLMSILLDPIYSAEAAERFIALIPKGHVKKGERPSFAHTGGSLLSCALRGDSNSFTGTAQFQINFNAPEER